MTNPQLNAQEYSPESAFFGLSANLILRLKDMRHANGRPMLDEGGNYLSPSGAIDVTEGKE